VTAGSVFEPIISDMGVTSAAALRDTRVKRRLVGIGVCFEASPSRPHRPAVE
jgi:hypothetical protein